MPYADPDRRREATRIRVARFRARARQAALGVTPNVTPDRAPGVTPAAADTLPPTAAELFFAGRILGVERLRGDTTDEFHARVKRTWQRLQRVVEG